MMKKLLITLGVLMIILVLAAAGGSYYAYQHRQELTQKAIDYAMKNMTQGLFTQKATASAEKTLKSNNNEINLGSLVGMIAGESADNMNLGRLAQNLMSTLKEEPTTPAYSANDINARDQKGRTLLMNICRTDASAKVIKMLLQYGADIDAVDEQGRTALMYAVALNRNPDVVAMLLKAGANRKARDYNGKSVFEYAADNEIKAVLKH